MASMRFIRAVNHAWPMLLCKPASHRKRNASQSMGPRIGPAARWKLRDTHASKVSLLMRFSRHRHVQLIALRLFHFDLRAALLHGALVSVLTDDNRSSKP